MELLRCRYDFLIDADLQPWLLEINCSPTVEHSTPVTAQLVRDVSEDVIKVTVDLPARRNYASLQRQLSQSSFAYLRDAPNTDGAGKSGTDLADLEDWQILFGRGGANATQAYREALQSVDTGKFVCILRDAPIDPVGAASLMSAESFTLVGTSLKPPPPPRLSRPRVVPPPPPAAAACKDVADAVAKVAAKRKRSVYQPRPPSVVLDKTPTLAGDATVEAEVDNNVAGSDDVPDNGAEAGDGSAAEHAVATSVSEANALEATTLLDTPQPADIAAARTDDVCSLRVGSVHEAPVTGGRASRGASRPPASRRTYPHEKRPSDAHTLVDAIRTQIAGLAARPAMPRRSVAPKPAEPPTAALSLCTFDDVLPPIGASSADAPLVPVLTGGAGRLVAQRASSLQKQDSGNTLSAARSAASAALLSRKLVPHAAQALGEQTPLVRKPAPAPIAQLPATGEGLAAAAGADDAHVASATAPQRQAGAAQVAAAISSGQSASVNEEELAALMAAVEHKRPGWHHAARRALQMSRFAHATPPLQQRRHGSSATDTAASARLAKAKLDSAGQPSTQAGRTSGQGLGSSGCGQAGRLGVDSLRKGASAVTGKGHLPYEVAQVGQETMAVASDWAVSAALKASKDLAFRMRAP